MNRFERWLWEHDVLIFGAMICGVISAILAIASIVLRLIQ